MNENDLKPWTEKDSLQSKRYDAVCVLVGPGVSCHGDDFTFHNGQTPPTEEEIEAEMSRLQAKFDSEKYKIERNYPNIREQLDMLFHDMTAGKGTKDGKWYKAIAKVKSDNPKEQA